MENDRSIQIDWTCCARAHDNVRSPPHLPRVLRDCRDFWREHIAASWTHQPPRLRYLAPDVPLSPPVGRVWKNGSRLAIDPDAPGSGLGARPRLKIARLILAESPSATASRSATASNSIGTGGAGGFTRPSRTIALPTVSIPAKIDVSSFAEGGGYSRVLTRQIVPDHSLAYESAEALRLVLRSAVGCYLLVGEAEIRIVFTDVDRRESVPAAKKKRADKT